MQNKEERIKLFKLIESGAGFDKLKDAEYNIIGKKRLKGILNKYRLGNAITRKLNFNVLQDIEIKLIKNDTEALTETQEQWRLFSGISDSPLPKTNRIKTFLNTGGGILCIKDDGSIIFQQKVEESLNFIDDLKYAQLLAEGDTNKIILFGFEQYKKINKSLYYRN